MHELQYDTEALHRFEWGAGRLKTSWGAGYREAKASGFMFQGRTPANNTGRLFAQQLAKLSNVLSLVGGASFEHSHTGGKQNNYQGALLINPSRNHTLRLSYSKSATIPNLFSAYGNTEAGSVSLHGNSDIKPQQLRSSEIGYGGLYLRKALDVDSSLYYMTIEDMNYDGSGPGPGGPGPGGPPPPQSISFDNSNSAIARGAEFSAKYKLGAGRSVYANYTYEYITDVKKDANVRKSTPRNKINLGFMTPVMGGVSLSANAGYKGVYTVQSMSGESDRIPAYWRLDAKLAYGLGGKSEVFFSCQNLLRAVHKEYADGYEVPRLFYAGVSLDF